MKPEKYKQNNKWQIESLSNRVVMRLMLFPILFFADKLHDPESLYDSSFDLVKVFDWAFFNHL